MKLGLDDIPCVRGLGVVRQRPHAGRRLESDLCPSSWKMPTPCATRVFTVPVFPWIPLYSDRDDTDIEVVAIQMTKADSSYDWSRVLYMQVLTTLSQTGISLPYLALFDIIQTYSILHLCVYEF